MSVKSSVRVSISIHALVKRATEGAKFVLLTFAISIHALVKRATYIFDKDGNVYDFNPRPRKEGDIYKSTRTSKGANFNPRPRKEGDLSLYGAKTRTGNFNPRPRKEGDIKNRGKKQQNSYFNPRPRKEGDNSILLMTFLSCRFQSTPS